MITIISCPRPGGVEYLSGLAVALRDEGVDWTVLVDQDGYRRRPPNNRDVGWLAIAAAAEAGDQLLFLEDDVRPIRPGAARAALAHRIAPGAAFASLCSSPIGQPLGVWPGGAFQGTRAVLFPPAAVRWLASSRATHAIFWRSAIGIDLTIATLAQLAGWSYEQASPLFEHVGRVSAADVRGY